MVIYSLNHFFLAVPMACRVSWVRDQTRATAANQASAVTKWEPSPALLMLFFFSEGQYHLFRDDGTVALICPQYGGFEISVSYADKFPIVFIAPCSSRVTSGPSLHAHGAGFFAVDQSQLTSPKEGSLFQGFKGPTLPKDLSHWFKGIWINPYPEKVWWPGLRQRKSEAQNLPG